MLAGPPRRCCACAIRGAGHFVVLSPLAHSLHGNIARERPPRATFTILPDVGHVPTLDDPKLVARTILAVTGATTS